MLEAAMRPWKGVLLLGCVWGFLGIESATQVTAQYPPYQLNLFYYYPYHYYPHNYWPAMGPRWPEPQGNPYQKPPAYMAYPPFREPNWRYELWQPQKYHRGSHFWLDQF
jgi:hypothetical protein